MKKETSIFGFGSISKASSWNEGLRQYMMGVYNYMTIALMLTAVVSYAVAKTGLAVAIFSSPLGIIFALAPLGMSIYIGSRLGSMSVQAVRNALLIYAGLMGVSLSTIFVAFRFEEIATAFAITASMFAGMSIYGYVTKKDLSSMGSIMFMVMWGLIVASVVNMFMHSSQMSLAISMISVVVFAGMVAFDTQKLRQIYHANGMLSDGVMSKIAIIGAMQLYIDFIAIFVHMLNLLRATRER